MSHEDTVLRFALACWLKDPRYGPDDGERAWIRALLEQEQLVVRQDVPRGTVENGHAPSKDWRIPREYVAISATERQELRRMVLGWIAVAMPASGIADMLRKSWEMEIQQADLFAW